MRVMFKSFESTFFKKLFSKTKDHCSSFDNIYFFQEIVFKNKRSLFFLLSTLKGTERMDYSMDSNAKKTLKNLQDGIDVRIITIEKHLKGRIDEDTYNYFINNANNKKKERGILAEEKVKEKQKLKEEECLNKILHFEPQVIEDDDEYFICPGCGLKLRCLKNFQLKVWKDEQVCTKCWMSHRDEIEDMFKQINGNNRKCDLCNTDCIIDNTRVNTFHYDHINMFDKNSDIYSMVTEGYSYEEIKKELYKCRFICIDCHDKITHAEVVSGFRTIKTKVNKAINEGKINKDIIEVLKEKYEIYMKHMYMRIKCQ